MAWCLAKEQQLQALQAERVGAVVGIRDLAGALLDALPEHPSRLELQDALIEHAVELRAALAPWDEPAPVTVAQRPQLTPAQAAADDRDKIYSFAPECCLGTPEQPGWQFGGAPQPHPAQVAQPDRRATGTGNAGPAVASPMAPVPARFLPWET